MSTRIGAVAWVVGTVQFFVVQLVVEAAWRTPYSWGSNNISDLGNVHCQVWDTSRPRYVCSPLHSMMNMSFAVHGALLLAGIVLTGVCWGRGGVARAARILCGTGGAAFVVVGLVPADVDENLHVLAALFIMGVGNVGLLCAGFVRRDSLFGRLRPVSLLAGAVAVISAGLFFAQQDPGIGLGGMERVAVFTLDAWTLVMAVAIRRSRGDATAPPARGTVAQA
ncbi:DUF998 domain-containing protein [Streptomyces sp. NPDC001922]|uniref:DUF998 domain-containing protein n=1 Tax=Streptomyces sp. NPDC001922 TaxID=3364624 RepID=UPI00369A00E8